MTDHRFHPTDASDADPSGERDDSLIRDALAHPADDRNGVAGRSDVAAPDPGRVAGHFAGVGDGDLLDAAARHETVRRLLVEISDLRLVADAASSAAATRSDAGPVRCSDAVRARALAAFSATSLRAPTATKVVGTGIGAASAGVDESRSAVHAEAVSGVSGGARRPVEMTRWRSARWSRAAVAASILIACSVGLLVGGKGAAAAVLALDGFDRVDAAGAVETAGPRRLSMGDEVSSGVGERVALRLADGARVVLGDRSRMSIGCDAPCNGRCGGAVFEVESGGVVAAAANSTGVAVPVALRVPSGGRVDVLSGAARVERDATGATSLELRADARVRWSPDGGPARELVGPAKVFLDAAGRLETRTGIAPGTAPDAAFRDLDFFGEPWRRVEDAIRVGARRWRIRSDDAVRSDQTGSVPSAPGMARGSRDDVGGLPVIRFDLDAGATGRVSWPADAPIYAARRLEVRFRVAASGDGASGNGPVDSGVVVRLDGIDLSGAGSDGAASDGAGSDGIRGVERTVTLGAPRSSAESGTPKGGAKRPKFDDSVLGSVVFDLPASFASAASSSSDLILSWSARGSGATIWFEGATFSSDLTGSPGAAGRK